MKIRRLMDSIGLGFGILICLALSACHKPPPFSPAAKTARLNWNLETTVGVYKKNGNSNPKWDFSAGRALTEFAQIRAGVVDTNETWSDVISADATAAVQAGCDDPMVNYLYIRYGMDQSSSKEAFTTAYLKMASDMNSSSYPPIRKFYASIRALKQYEAANRHPAKWPSEISDLDQQMRDDVSEMLNDKTTPSVEIYQASREFLTLWGRTPGSHQKHYDLIETKFFANWPDDPFPWMLKGECYIAFAWDARGNGDASTVTADGLQLFKTNLDTAEDAFGHAWKLDPKDPWIAEEMITVELGQGKSRDRMELWFKRAMDLDPNDYAACSDKLYYLEPKWYGSDADQLAFGHECLQSTNWGGRVPLVLLDAHAAICGRLDPSDQPAYWKQPTVWPDIKSAFDRFFELNPDAVGWHHDYAHYAYLCGQWDEFLHQTTLFTSGTNYSYFGGKDAFDYMVETAKSVTGGK